MNKYKTINKQQNNNIFKIQKILYSIQGKILFITSSENNNMFIITDNNLFYAIEKGLSNKAKKYKIPPIGQKNRKYQTEDKESQLWCDKLGNHIIIKYNNNLYYYNPNLIKEKILELNLFYNNYYLQPYSIAFDNDFYDTNDTGYILFSDFNSDIYLLRIQINQKNKMSSIFFRLFSFTPKKYNINKDDEDEDDEDSYNLNFFKMDKNERILDIKIILSCENKDIYEANTNNEGKKLLILAITKNKIFQFYGKDSYQKVFDNYSIESGNLIKACKLFHNKKNFNLKKSRIQLFNQYLPFYKYEKFKKTELLFSCMFQCGYCIGRFEDILNPIPIKEFIIYDYPQIEKNNKIPIMVYQSLIHIFYLYDKNIIIKNKLSNRITTILELPEPILDIYYNLVMNEIILYSSNYVYKISLDIENKYLWEYYIEIGQFKFALKTLGKNDKYMKPILHKLYANQLFDQKNYLDAAEHYAFSDEKFEHVCLKFLCVVNIDALLKYLSLIFSFKLQRKNNNKKNNNNINLENDKYFIEKYLINTWIFELLILKKLEKKEDEIIPFIKEYTRNPIHGKDYIDKCILYYVLKCHSKFPEIIEYEKVNQDYEVVILNLISIGKTMEALEYIKIFFYFGIENLNIIIKNIFYKYGSVFMKNNPKETISLLDNNFQLNNNPQEIIKIILNIDKDKLKEEDIKYIINYIKKLILIEYNSEKQIYINDNLMYLLLFFLSLINNKEYKKDLIYSFKDLININKQNIIDFNFDKNIFKNDINTLSLFYCISGKYNKFVEFSLDNNLKGILKFVLTIIENRNIKNKLIHLILLYKHNRNELEYKNVLNDNENKNNIQIFGEFVLKITDKLKINIFNDFQLDNSFISNLLP